jgi:pyruvate formate lyase activating enzyme
VTRFFPMHRLQSAAATPAAAIQHAIDIGHAAGLKFVYSGNVRGQGEDTVCYSCGRTLIRRVGYNTEVLALRGSACGHCGVELNVRGVKVASAGRREGGTDAPPPERSHP